MKHPSASTGGVEMVRDMMERQVMHLSRLVDDLLDVSRLTRGKIVIRKEVVELAGIIHAAVEAVRPLLEEHRHELSVSLPREPIQVEADPTRLEQVLTNLLNNAAKFTEPGGKIWLSVEEEEDCVIIRVRDTGIGIAPEMLPRVFDLFEQAERRLDRSRGGLGIGLTLVQRLVELHGGTVQVVSEGLEKGSEFALRLPYQRGTGFTPLGRRAEDRSLAVPRCRRVLVVDDKVDAAASTAMVLRMEGHDVRVAHDGPAALWEAQSDPPDVVLVDIAMPGMDGYEVARRLRQLPGMEQVLLVAVTGYGQPHDRHRSREAGFDQHLVKPVEPEVLLQLLK
jgi:CheY-like chemotaxis protein